MKSRKTLPLGRTICFLFLPHCETSITGIETVTGPKLYSRRGAGPYRRLDFGFSDGEVLREAVAPHGADWIVCCLIDRARSVVCRIVPLEGAWLSLDGVPGAVDWKVASLISPAPKAGCFHAVVWRLCSDGRVPPKSLYAQYAIARVGRRASEFRMISENVDPRFRVG